MTKQEPETPIQKLGLDPGDVERFLGVIAVTFVRYLVAGMRSMKGEGRMDPVVDPLMEKMLGAMGTHIEQLAMRGVRWFISECLDDMIAVYRKYLDGTIESQADLREVLKGYFEGIGIELTSDQLDLLVADRETISQEHRGPAQFAEFAMGKLSGVHWKTIHNWSTSSNEWMSEQTNGDQPYGIAVSPQETIDFISKYAAFELENATDLLLLLSSARERIGTPAREASPGRRRGGPGRPRRTKR